MKLINADELELDTEWSDYYDGFTSYSQGQINEAEEVKAIPLDKVKQAREKMWKNVYEYSGTGNEVLQAYSDGFKASLQIIDKLIEEVKDAKAGDHERTI